MIGENIKNIREKQGMTQVELRQKTDVTQAMLSQIERGSKVPSAVLLKQIADVLKVKIGTLYGES